MPWVNDLVQRGKPVLMGGPRGFLEPLPPQFVIHTGDAVDAGLISELSEFIAVMHELDVPFYSLVGNHDNLFFGTLPPPDPAPKWMSLRSTADFVRQHYHDPQRSIVKRSAHDPTLHGLPRSFIGGKEGLPVAIRRLPVSMASGFDLYEPAKDELPPGYYTVDIDLPDAPDGFNACSTQKVAYRNKRRVVLIALNTAAIGPNDVLDGLTKRKSAGELDEKQLAWLGEVLDHGYDRCTWFLVAGHHPVDSFIDSQRDEFYERLVRNGRVLAYFSGHTHRNSIRRHPTDPRKAPRLWEVVGGSTLVHPQFGLLVDLLLDRSRTDWGFLRVRSFRQRLSDVSASCSLQRFAKLGWQGAHDDQIDGDWKDEDVAIHDANGMLPVRLR